MIGGKTGLYEAKSFCELMERTYAERNDTVVNPYRPTPMPFCSRFVHNVSWILLHSDTFFDAYVAYYNFTRGRWISAPDVRKPRANDIFFVLLFVGNIALLLIIVYMRIHI